jgi:hypothetical protein
VHSCILGQRKVEKSGDGKGKSIVGDKFVPTDWEAARGCPQQPMERLVFEEDPRRRANGCTNEVQHYFANDK